jgi:hypothetical protein
MRRLTGCSDRSRPLPPDRRGLCSRVAASCSLGRFRGASSTLRGACGRRPGDRSCRGRCLGGRCALVRRPVGAGPRCRATAEDAQGAPTASSSSCARARRRSGRSPRLRAPHPVRSSGISRCCANRPRCARAGRRRRGGARPGERRARSAVGERLVGPLGAQGVAAGRAPARRRRPATARGRSAARCEARPPRSPRLRSATESGADLMN